MNNQGDKQKIYGRKLHKARPVQNAPSLSHSHMQPFGAQHQF
jgi:hypothetical protein